MSVSYQSAVLADLDRIAEDYNLLVLTEFDFANTGRLHIGTTTDIRVTVQFDFQSRSPNKLLINGAEHGPPGVDNYYIHATETERYAQFLARIKELLEP